MLADVVHNDFRIIYLLQFFGPSGNLFREPAQFSQPLFACATKVVKVRFHFHHTFHAIELLRV